MYRAFHYFAALALLGAAASAAWAVDDDQGVMHETGDAITSGAEATGHAVKRGAEATGHAVERGAEITGGAIKSGAQATGNALGLTDRDREYYTTHERGQQRMTGRVAMIDSAKGRVSLEGQGSTYQLHFPPQSLAGVNVGDELVVVSGFARPQGEETSAASQPSGQDTGERPGYAGDAPAANGEMNSAPARTHQEAINAADQGISTKGMRGEHWMNGTITDVDRDNGIVGLQTDEGQLKVQFAPEAARDLHQGDRIAVNLAFEEEPTAPSSTR